MWSEDRLGVEQILHHAANGRFEMPGSIVLVKNVATFIVEHTDMQMHARAGLVGIRLSHERASPTMLLGSLRDEALKTKGVTGTSE